jgi:hypothetical protein
MDNFLEAVIAIKSLQSEGIISAYAIGGAMAQAFWSEPTPTFDLDVFVVVKASHPLAPLTEIYSWATRRGYEQKAEHIFVASVPIQFLPVHSRLAEEAVQTAVELNYLDESVRVMRPEYLIALSLEPSARTMKRLARVGVLLESAPVDRKLLEKILGEHELKLPEL